MKISARNLLKGKVLEVKRGQTTAHVKKGRLAHLGPPHEVITSENLRAITGSTSRSGPSRAAETGSGFVPVTRAIQQTRRLQREVDALTRRTRPSRLSVTR
jgi:hypothetical protein